MNTDSTPKHQASTARFDTLGWVRGIHFALVFCLIGSVARAQDSGDSNRIADAQAAYAEGAEAFSAGRFGEALDRFTRAYELAPRAALLYNIGTAHDRLGHDAQALSAYRDYLEATPEARNREYTEARIRVLEDRVRALEEQMAAQNETAETETTQVQPTESSSGANVPAIVLLALGGAAVIGAATSGGLALAQHGELDDACPMGACTPEHRDDLNRLDRLTRTTDVLIGLAAAAAITGVILLIVGRDDDDDARVSISPLGVRVAL